MESLTLKHCFIFNPTLCSKKKKPTDDEMQEAKLLFYYPSSEVKLIKLSNMGIIEGTLGFINIFEQTNSQFLLTELNKCYYVANNYERDLLVVFILQKASPMFSYYQNINTKKQWFKEILDNFYSMLYLFHGEIMSLYFPEGKDIRENETEVMNLTAKIGDFICNYFDHFSSMRLPFLSNVVYISLYDQSQAGILLSVQRLKEKIVDLDMISIVYKGHVVHNQLPLDSFSLFFNLFYSSLDFLPKFNSFGRPPYEVVQNLNLDTTQLKEEKISPFRKVFEIGVSTSDYLIGAKKASTNDYSIFIPTVYIQSTSERYKLVVYYYNGMVLFFFLNDKFNYLTRLNDTLLKAEKWIKKYFDEHFQLLEQCYKQKVMQNDFITFAYCNNANYSLKLSSNFFNKKTKSIDNEKFELLRTALELNSEVKLCSLTKFKGNYLYYINSCERKIVMIYNDNISLPQLRTNIDNNKKELFDSIFIL